MDLAPNEPRYAYERGMAYLGNNQPILAMADLDQALKLKPDDVAALMARAHLRLAARDRTDVLADLAAIDRVAPREADIRLALAGLYGRVDVPAAAIGQFDLWIKAHPEDSRLGQALGGRCWARALAGRDFDKALKDCDGALRITPKNPDVLNSRGLVHLRLGDLDKAIADYDAALSAQPKIAWSLYGRGVARLRKGLTAEGQADIAAATALRPRLPEEAKAHGIAS
jgi:tetratricopeptide (TPR) repeat protein